jgi:hypothetical protein
LYSVYKSQNRVKPGEEAAIGITDGDDEVAGEIGWSHGHVVVEKLAGRIADLTFRLTGGIECRPFAPPPWLDDGDAQAISPLLRRLRGEWPCVPFGFDVDRARFGDWAASSAGDAIDTPHGHSSSHAWSVTHVDPRSLVLSLDYPPDHPISRLERRIEADQDAPALDITLAIEARRDCRLPIGLHPMFSLPPEQGGVEIEVGGDQETLTFPGRPVPSSRFRPDTRGNLAAVALDDGATVDGRAVPLAHRGVELVQVLRAGGAATLFRRDAGYAIDLAWDPRVFPSVLLWYSNRGNDAPPWNGQHLALGVEPICSAFDLGVGVSARENPISARGIPTTVRIWREAPLVTRYRLSARAIPGPEQAGVDH